MIHALVVRRFGQKNPDNIATIVEAVRPLVLPCKPDRHDLLDVGGAQVAVAAVMFRARSDEPGPYPGAGLEIRLATEAAEQLAVAEGQGWLRVEDSDGLSARSGSEIALVDGVV